MSDSSTATRPEGPGCEPALDPERLDVYRLALEFHALASACTLLVRIVQMLSKLELSTLSRAALLP